MKLMILDGNSIVNRAFYGIRMLNAPDGTPTNAVYGFLTIFQRILELEQPQAVCVAFDVHAPTFRHEMYPEYKGTRKPMPQELHEQVPVMKQVLHAMGIRTMEQPGLEADDILGTLAKRAEKEGMDVSLVSGDRDLLQIASDKIKIRIPKTKGARTEVEDYYAADVEAKYGVTPAGFIELKALMGDTADNIPGVPKVGEKTASELLKQFQTLDNLYAHVEEVTKNLGSGLYLSTQVIHIPRGSGLGTSSILAGACVKAIYQMLGKKLSQEELYNRVLCMEQIMSTGGGWQDQVGGLAPGIKMVTSDAAIVQEIGCSPCSISTETLQELNERFCLIYSGQRRLARNLLRDIVSRYVSGNPDTVEVLYEIQRIAVLMRFELEKGNVDGFAQLLNQHWELSKRLDGGCTNTCIDMIFSSVEDLIDGKMICGVGGGGFLQVILKKGVTVEQVQKRLREVFQDSGVEVWRCSLV